ncbi:MAG TPA: hypothetical protein VES40_07495 [Ilumatobacteraceae bacterium]|nr:hypothetical protein [Ilumatobacteraceae bacterium]
MTTDDDRIREALSRGEPSFTAHSTLQQLRPTMQRARLRRRVATGAATLALLAGGSAAVLAVTTTQNAPTLRTLPSDESEQSAPITASTTMVPTKAPNLSSVPTSVVVDPEPETSAVAPEVEDAGPQDANNPAPGAKAPVPTPAPKPLPATTAPPPPAPPPPAPPTTAPPTTAPPATVAAPAVSQTIASDCGDVLVSIENGTVRILSITARPGYQSEVSDGGPISIEVVLRSAAGKCELHAELKSGGLDIEVQNSPADR